MLKDRLKTEFTSTLALIIKNNPPSNEEICRKDDETILTATNIKSAFQDYGHDISLGQAEDVYSAYSYNNFASWIVGGCKTKSEAILMLTSFCEDIEHGENHIGY